MSTIEVDSSENQTRIEITKYADKTKNASAGLICGSILLLSSFSLTVGTLAFASVGIAIGILGCRASLNYDVKAAYISSRGLFVLTLGYIVYDSYLIWNLFLPENNEKIGSRCQSTSVEQCRYILLGLQVIFTLVHFICCGSCFITCKNYHKSLASAEFDVHSIPQFVLETSQFHNPSIVQPEPLEPETVDVSAEYDEPPPSYRPDGDWDDESAMIDSNLMAYRASLKDDEQNIKEENNSSPRSSTVVEMITDQGIKSAASRNSTIYDSANYSIPSSQTASPAASNSPPRFESMHNYLETK